jgi:hypothetical protein
MKSLMKKAVLAVLTISLTISLEGCFREWLVRVVYESEKALTGALNSLFWAVPFSKN